MAVLFCSLAFPAAAQQNNSFQISPAPIPYPYFESGRWDGQINGMGASLSASGFSAGLGGFSGSFRYSFNDFLAWDFAGNMGVGGFNMTSESLKGSMVLGGFSTNLEAQLGGKNGGLIVFGGPSFEGFNLTNSATTLQYGQFGSMGAFLSGGQFGVQGNIKLGDAVRLAPFVMVQSLGGSSSVTGNFGGGTNTTVTSQIPANTSTSYGLDILINNWSLGTFLQELQQSSSSSNNGNVHMVVFQVGYSFGNADQLAKEKEEASLNGPGYQNQSARCQEIAARCKNIDGNSKRARWCSRMSIAAHCQASPAEQQPSQDEFQAPKM